MGDAEHQRLRWAHANIRLKLRYDLDITLEEYQAANEKFRQRKGVEGLRQNHKGDLEGWIEIRPDVWVAALFSARDSVIATFFAPPPPRIAVTKEKATEKPTEKSVSDLVEKAVQSALAQQRGNMKKELMLRAQKSAVAQFQSMVRQWKKDQIAQGARSSDLQVSPEAPVLEESSVIGNPKMADLRWLKLKMTRAKELIRMGKPDEAAELLDAVAGLPRSFQPTADLAATERLLRERVASERARLAAKAAG